MDAEKKKVEVKNATKKKGFWKNIVEKLDRVLVDKAQQSSCCSKDAKGGKCC